jgi:hypothetical protein
VGGCTAIEAGKQGQSTTDGSTYVNFGAKFQVACVAGKYSTDGAGACSSIGAGKQGQTSSSGSTYVSSGASFAVPCVKGKYSTDGAGACNDCTSFRTTSSTGSTSAADCKCPINTYASSGANDNKGTCLGCANGGNTDGKIGVTAASACICAAGFYSNNGKDGSACTACPVNTYKAAASNGGASLCVACNNGGDTDGRKGAISASTCRYPVNLDVDVTLQGLTVDAWNADRAASEAAFKASMFAQLGVSADFLKITIISVTASRARRRLNNPGALLVVKSEVTGKVEAADDTTISNSLSKSLSGGDFTRSLAASSPIFRGVVVENLSSTVPSSQINTKSSDSGGNVGGIVGGIVGSIVVLGAGLFFYKRSVDQKRSAAANAEIQNANDEAAYGAKSQAREFANVMRTANPLNPGTNTVEMSEISKGADLEVANPSDGTAQIHDAL